MPRFVDNCLAAPGLFFTGLLIMAGIALVVKVYDAFKH